ncbi:MAG: beta-galactosidase trimerization domain-containing protein [Verrucomicrobiae bacterium]|nr:beta-galactosidase trimerization domain-containing protein [Verrucomicrobiae bacterium]
MNPTQNTPWWTAEPLRIIEISNAWKLDSLSLEEELETVKRLGGNAQHFHAWECAAGFDDQRMYFETQAARRKNPDRIAAYLPMARQNGIRLIVYFNVHWQTRDFGRQHPDWTQIRENGSPLDDVYSTGTSFCVNSPYREWVFQILRDLCRYEIDGVFYDGPIFFAGTCYCPACKTLFRKQTGQDMPLKSDRQNPLWTELTRFQADSLARFLADSNSIIKNIRPDILFYMNGNANWPWWPTGRDNKRIIEHTDILGAEGGFLHGDLNRLPVYKPSVTAKLLESQARGKPTVVFDCAGHKPWSWHALPEGEIDLLLKETTCHGANAWLAIFPDDRHAPALKAVSDHNRFVAKNPEAFCRTESMARIALLWPALSAEVYNGSSVPVTDFTREVQSSGIGDLGEEFNGFYEGLVRGHFPFDVIDEKKLEHLEKYDLLFLPNAACLSSTMTDSIRAFVKKGGRLVASFETSLYDEKGIRQKNFQLSDVFGLNFGGALLGPMDWDYFSPVSPADPQLPSPDGKKFIPAPQYGIQVEPAGGKNLFVFCKKLKGRYDSTPESSSQPFLCRNSFGKGEAFHFAGTFGGGLSRFCFPEYLELVKNLGALLSRPMIAVEGAPFIEVSMRRNERTLFIHLINQTTGARRPAIQIQPLHDVRLTFPGLCCSHVTTLGGSPLVVEQTAPQTSIRLPLLKNYEVIQLRSRAKITSHSAGGNFAGWQGASDEHTLHGSVSRKQRSQPAKSPQPAGARQRAGICGVARQSKIHEGYSPSSRLASACTVPLPECELIFARLPSPS